MSTLSNPIADLSPEQLAKLRYELKASKARKQEEIPRRVPGEPCPLSFAQQRLWFIAQLEPDNPFYNCLEILRLTGKLNLLVIEQTFSELVRRHEILRTTFDLVGGEPAQLVSSEFKLNLRVIDLQSLPESEREKQAPKLSAAENLRPFDLTRGPLLRVDVLRISEHEHVIVFVTHHLISDGWSKDVLVREIIALYSAFAEGRPSPLPELPAQYGDFAIWQRQRLTGPVLERHLDYWKRQLADAPHMLALPTDHPRPAVPTRRGGHEFLTLSRELTHSLRTLGRRKGVTLFMTLLGAFDVLLSRYSGQTDFLIGTDIANRRQGTTEALIGFFVNQLVLRVDLAGDPTFNELLERVKEVTLNGYAHQEAPFEKVVEMLSPERNLSHAPLYQVKLVLQNTSTNNLELPELTLGVVQQERPVAKFDLMFAVYESEHQLGLVLEYAIDLFEASTISRMLTQFERLLASAVRDPEQHISQLDLLSSAERQQLLVERNATGIPYPHTQGIHELFEEQVALSPDAPALRFQGQHLSYAELNSRANQLAHYLRELGVTAETPVGVCLHRSIEMIVAFIAILKAGGVYVPLDPEYPAERLAFILDDLSLPIILTDSSLVDELPASWALTVCLDTENEMWSALPTTDLSDIVISSDSLAYVMYTSGSTGNPKGVAVPHRAVVRLVKQGAYVDFGPGEVFLQLAPVTFDASTLEIWGALLNGGRLVLMPPGVLSLPELGTVLRSEGVTVLWLTAGLFHLMVEQELEALACVSQVVAGGDVLSVEHVRRLVRAKNGSGAVVNGYGPTETTTFACCYRMSGETGLEHGVPIGSPIGNTQVYVLGEKMELVGPGMVGELYIGGDGLARGYCNQPELTAERFVPHPFSTAGGERLYRTGDQVRWRAGGILEFVGRRDTQVKIRGYRVEPGEVEAVLAQHGSVKECAVVSRAESNGEKRLVAYVVDGNYEHDVNAFALREYLRERLPEFMLPSAIVELESLPLTPNGKVDRRELAAREVEIGREHSSYVPPSTITEELLCDVWAEVLRVARVGIDDNFFDLGGDSILTIQVIVKARALGLELTVQQLFQHQTIYALAQVLQLSDKSAEVPQTEPFSLISDADRMRLPAGVVDAYPLTALQVGMLFHSELAPEAGVYHDIFSFHLRLPYDADALQATLQHLIDLHPVLRTSFNLSDFSEPLQLVHEEVAAPLQVGDLRGLSPTEQEEYLAQWLAKEKRHPFDWRKAPLLRFQIERRSEESFQFLFSFHHAILDGWSVATMLTELFMVYSVMRTGDHSSEAPLSTSFRDFVAAERDILESDEARQYWSTMLSDSTRTRLPRLIEAGPMGTAARAVRLSPELLEELKGFARTAGVPLKSVLLAAHLRVLSLLSGSDDVLTGVVSHGRPETKDSKRVLGLFLNTLPFRQKLSGGTWLELVQETFRAERELLPFRRYPMARVQQDVGNVTPLFEVIFNFLHFHVYEELENVSGVEVLDRRGSADTNYTLNVDFHLMLGGAGIVLVLEYDTSQLSESQIEAATQYYLTTLEKMVRTPTARYEQQWLLSKEECRTILHEWNEPAPPDLYRECYHHLFEAQVARTPNALAAVLVADGLNGEQLTYEELNQRANQLAHYLRGLGVEAEVPVGMLLDRSLETIVTLLAILKAGGVYVPLDKQQPLERQQYVVDDAGLTLLLTHSKFKDLLPSGVRAIYLDLEQPTIAEQSPANVASVVDPANLAYVIYTSGSTGRPKGVGVPHEVIVSHCLDIKDHCELQPRDRVPVFSSFSFDVSLEEILPSLLTGASLVVRDESVWTPKEFVQVLAEQQLTIINLPTNYWHNLTQDCVAAGDFDTTYDLRLACAGGEALRPETVRLWQSSAMRSVRLLNLCGPTETIITATSFEVPTLPDAFPLPTIPIGRPLGTRTAYILDNHGNPVPVGVPGEWHVGGPVMARGYLNRPDLTAEKFIPDVFSDQPGARLYRTGDLARYLPDGNIEFLGRIDQQVKLRGFRIELGEIEAVLKQHASVREAVVVLHETQRLIGYVQLNATGEVEASELRAFLKERLPEYMVPARFVEVAEFALTPSGKINRRVLPALEGIFAGETKYEAPRTPTEELLSELWASVLRVDRVGINDNFFELGGHSLLATQLVSRVRETFGVELPLRELFERPTVADLAEQVEAALRGGVGLTAPPLVPVSREQELPLSFAQQRLWFLDQLEPSGSFYNQPAAVRLHGVLNVAALEQTLSEVVRRHEALRTTFVAVGGEPLQVIKPFTPVTLPVFDLSELDTAEREAETRRLLSEEMSRPFDLAHGPLVRACLVRLGAEEHVVLVTMHHIVSDGWSQGIFIREVAALYQAFLAGEESPLAELPIQYADFAHWQRGWLQGEVLAAQLDYWREALAEMPGVLELPTDRPRPPEQTFNGAMVSLEVPAELTSQLKALSRRERVTLFMTLLAAFQSLLFRYSGQDDIVVGTPIANRRYRELEDLIGFFVNTLALRARSLKTLTFTELLQRVREVTLSAYAHQDLPFEKLVEELQPERDLSRNPVFQVNFVFQNVPSSELQLPGLTLQGQELESQTTRFDLECDLWEEGEALRGFFVYNTDLFDRATIQRMAANFETLLHSIAANPAEAVANLRLLSADDERQLLYGWNETSAEFQQEVVHELFARQVERTPHHTAVVFEDVSLTFLELNRRSNLLAARLQRMGVGADTVVGVMLERSVEMLVGVLGVLKAGGAYLPLDPEYPAERLQFMLADAAVRVLLTQEHLAHNIDADVQIIRLDAGDTEGDAIGAQAEENPRAAVTGDNLAYVIYTSGSTGKPKGVAMTHRPLANLVSWEVRRVGAPLRSSQFASLSFDVSFQEIFTTLCSGGTLVLIPEEKRRDAKQLLELVIDQKIERLCVPFVALNYLALVAEAEGKWPTHLRQVMSAGEQLKITGPIRRLFENIPGCTLDNQCGPSETHAVVGFLLPASVKDWTALPPIGRPLSNVRLYVLDKQMRPVPAGVPGTLYIAGDCISRGYLHRPDLTADRYVPNPFSERGERLYRSGDIVRYLPTGDVEWLRREDDQVKIRGFRVELGEIEAALMEQPTVREAVAVARVESRGEKRLVAYVVSESGVEVQVEELRQALRAQLPEYMVPSAIVVLEELPLTPSGKINRRALPAPESIFAEEDEAPRTQVEELLSGIWASVLRVERVGVHNNFFELGGHSLLATQLMSRVREAFAVELPLRELFAQPTVAGLAAAVEAALRGGLGVTMAPLVPVSREQQLPLSHAQERLWFLDQLEPGRAIYNLPGAIRLKGQLDVAALERTLNEVVRRHEVLRTTFVAVSGEAVQVIAAASQLPLPVLDLSELEEEQREREAVLLAQAEAARAFDLSSGPLVRVQLLRLGEADHVLLFTLHHTVTDGWSTGILVREVAALYEAYIEGRESPLPELAIQYADYAVWQREWLQGEVLEQQLSYWRQQLEELPALQLPTDKARPPMPSHRGRAINFNVPAQLTAELKQLSTGAQVTLYMTLLAAFKILLWRYSGQSEVVVGTPIAGRNHLATEGLIGLFVNTLVLRTSLSGNPTFAELLERVRDVTLGAYTHQDLPFEKLVEELQPERDMSRSPLFQVMFMLQNATTETLRLPELEASELTGGDDSAKFDLTLALAESNDGLAGTLQYSVDLFEAATIERLAQHYELLLEAIAGHPERQLSELPLLLDAERQKLLVEWNNTQVAYDHETCVHELFEEQVRRTPSAVAVVFEDTQLTYGELNARANQLARYLRRV